MWFGESLFLKSKRKIFLLKLLTGKKICYYSLLFILKERLEFLKLFNFPSLPAIHTLLFFW